MRIDARYEVAAELRSAYWDASRTARRSILDHFCAVTGYNRKYAIAVLRGKGRRRRATRRRPRRYGTPVVRAVRMVWESSGWVCAERLKPILPSMADQLVHHGSLDMDEELRMQLCTISVSTLKRLMRELDTQIQRRRQSTTRPGTLLRREIPIAIGAHYEKPGWLEIDLVAHCGASAAGEFVFTLCATDVLTGWTERVAVLGKSALSVVSAMQRIRDQLPFPLHGIHSDNGSEFINDLMLKWCRSEQIIFQRGRPYAKNDNAHVEERNWTLVRKLIGYERLETPEQRDGLNVLYTEFLRFHNNGFQPIMKLIEKQRIDGRLRKRYDVAATPMDRVRRHTMTAELRRFITTIEATNPLLLKRRIDRLIASMPIMIGAHIA